MEILVFIKQVPDDSVDIKLNPATGGPNLDGVTPVTNAFDTYALEMATRFKEEHGGKITVATIGGDGTVASIKECLAVGGDQGFLIKCDDVDALDAAAKAALMANAVPKLEELVGAKYDIIFTGKEATDYAGGITGVTLAAKLGVGVMTDVIAVDPADGGVDVKQMTESGYNVVGLATPCVVTIQKPDYDPRYPTIKSKMKARKAEVPVIAAADLGDAPSLTKVLGQREPAKKQAGVKLIPTEDEPIAAVTVRAVGMMAAAKVL
jgi:electron transfer flavoprotein beta subunit